MIFVNFKTFEEASGDSAVKLAKTIEEVSSDTGIKIIAAVQASDIKEVVGNSKIEVWAQHIDPVEYGAHTGATIPEAVAEDGAQGTFLNHSENKISNTEKLSDSVSRAKDAGLKILIFATSIEELKSVLALTPTYVAYEPAELVGSKTTSVAQAKPEIIEAAANLSRQSGIPLIVGAGIHSREDVYTSLKLGAVGIAVATDIVKAQDPKKELIDLAEGFK